MGDRIARLRHRAGMSQAMLAKRLGLSASAIGMYEQGRREPPLDILVSMAMEFGVTTDYLLIGRVQTEGDLAVLMDGDREGYAHLAALLRTVLLGDDA